MFAVHTEDTTARGFYEDYAATDLTDALAEASARWDRFTREEKKERVVTVYDLPAEDYARIQEGEGTYDNYAFEVKVYALGYIGGDFRWGSTPSASPRARRTSPSTPSRPAVRSSPAGRPSCGRSSPPDSATSSR